MGGFNEWIDDVTYHSIFENTVRFIVNVAHFKFPDLTTAVTRCSASVITNVHVLTTASCVTVKFPQQVAVQTVAANETTNSSCKLKLNEAVMS